MKFSPMLAKLVDAPFDRKGWIFEMKWDGYRAMASKSKRSLQLISRNQKIYNHRYPDIVTDLKKIPGTFVVDGEIVLIDAKGRPNFQLLQNYQKLKEGTLCYYLFDILSLNGKDLHKLPLIERKKILRKLVPSHLKHIKYSKHIKEKGKAFFREIKKRRLEGIMAKNGESPYQGRRSSDWLKIKTKMRQEVVIGGFTEPRGSRKHFGALLVGVYENKKFVYVGHVGTGFDTRLLEVIYQALQKNISKKSPFSKEPKPNMPVVWVKPKLVCEVAFTEWTKEGIMRHPTFEGMRDDKSAKSVH